MLFWIFSILHGRRADARALAYLREVGEGRQASRSAHFRSPMAADSQPRPDDALVHAARRGDRHAFAELYTRYRGPVHAVVMARVPARDAGDLVQDVFVIALKRIGGLRDDGAFGGWLLTIARNRATDYHRRSQPTSELPADLGAPSPPRAEVKQVLEAIRTLPESYRETLLMRLVEGMTGPEIAERTGLEPGSVRVNLHRGMKLLRAKLEVAQ